MFDRLSGTLFGLKKIGKYLTDAELRKAYAEYKESEEIAFRLIVNALLSEGWLVALSQPRTVDQIASEFSYSNTVLLKDLLLLLTDRGMLEQSGETFSIRELSTTPIRAEDIGTVLTNFYYDCASFLPQALRGETLQLDTLPRVVLDAVFSSPFTEIGRSVLLRSFAGKKTNNIGIAGFADVGVAYIVRQMNDIFKPKHIHLFLHDYRWLAPTFSMLRLLLEETVVEGLSTHLFGIQVEMEELDLFYGEELFAFQPKNIMDKAKTVSTYLKPGGKIITNDPTVPTDEHQISPAYALMRTIKDYPQPLDRKILTEAFEANSLKIQTVGDNWIIAEKVGELS